MVCEAMEYTAFEETKTMNQTVSDTLSSLKLGALSTQMGITVIPLLAQCNATTKYLTLVEAISKEVLFISETSHSGSVPQLLAKNSSPLPILILDGEELQGAKQNRVLNTSVLLKEYSQTEIPVSCTEAGRWSYRSAHFEDSDIIMAKMARAKKNRSVSSSLHANGFAYSDQGEVWDEIRKLNEKLGTGSATGAMRDSYVNHRVPLSEWSAFFPCVDQQIGLIVLSGDGVLGMELLSNCAAYSQVHDRILKSYLVDFIRQRPKEKSCDYKAITMAFITSLLSLHESEHNSVGYGKDYRYASNSLCGSALVHEGEVLHAAFFNEKRDDHRRQQQVPDEVHERTGRILRRMARESGGVPDEDSDNDAGVA